MNDFNEQILRIPRLMNDFNEQILRFVNPKSDVRKVIGKPCKTLYTVNVRLSNTNMAQRYFGQKPCVRYEFSLTTVSWLVNFLSNTRLTNMLGLSNFFKSPKSFVTQESGVYHFVIFHIVVGCHHYKKLIKSVHKMI